MRETLGNTKAFPRVSFLPRTLIGNDRVTVPSSQTRPICTPSLQENPARSVLPFPPMLFARASHSARLTCTSTQGTTAGWSSPVTRAEDGADAIDAATSSRLARAKRTVAATARASSGADAMVCRASASSACLRVREPGRGLPQAASLPLGGVGGHLEHAKGVAESVWSRQASHRSAVFER